MALSRRSLIFCLLAFFPGVWALAQGSGQERPKGVPVTAVWLKGQGANLEGLHLVAGKTPPQPFQVGKNSRGKPAFVPPGQSAVQLYLKPEAPAVQTGQVTAAPQPVLLGEVNLPSTRYGSVLLLLAASPDGKKIRGVALPDDPAAFPAHSLKILNYAPGQLQMRLDEKVTALKSGSSDAIPYPKVAKPGEKVAPSIPFALANADGIFFNGRIDAWEGSRTLIVIAPSEAEGKPPVIQSIIDRPAPPPR